MLHLYNAMPAFSHHSQSYWGGTDANHVKVELICDGVHIDPSVVRATFKMFGDDHHLISDSMRATGLEDGDIPWEDKI